MVTSCEYRDGTAPCIPPDKLDAMISSKPLTRCEDRGEKWVNNGSKEKLINWLPSPWRKEQDEKAYKATQGRTCLH